MRAALLDDDFRTRLERLELASRRIVLGRRKGERRSGRRGHSVEFADHRPYVTGDDIRHIDWNVYGRLDRLVVKVFLEEEDLGLNVLLDASPSMRYGHPEKLEHARKLAAALGYVGLTNHDRVRIAAFAGRPRHVFGPARGRHLRTRMLECLDRLEAPSGEGTDLARSCREFAGGGMDGIVVFISDFFDRSGFESALRSLAASGRFVEVFAFQVLAPQEIEPDLAGDLCLVDMEDGSAAEVTASTPLLKAYERSLAAFQAEIRTFCSERGIHYIFTSTARPFDELVLGLLRRQGLLR